MSDVVVPSFFPTPHEIAGGIRWMREHPVVATAAAAAATAVSVLTYLKSRADDDECTTAPLDKRTTAPLDKRTTAPLDKRVTTANATNSTATDHTTDDCAATRERFQTWSDSYAPQDDDVCAALPSKRTASRSTTDLATVATPTQCRRQSEPPSDDVYSATESEVSTTSPTVRRSHPSSSSVSNFAFSCCHDDDDTNATTTAAADAADTGVPSSLRVAFPESLLEEDDGETTTSPQWGWYVSTTPPEERYA